MNKERFVQTYREHREEKRHLLIISEVNSSVLWIICAFGRSNPSEQLSKARKHIQICTGKGQIGIVGVLL